MRRWLERWWSQKYKLPPNDPRFRTATPGALFREMLEDYAAKREELREALAAGRGDRNEILKALTSIDQVLGYRKPEDGETSGDDLVDEWDKALEAGVIPESLTRGLVKPKKPAKSSSGLDELHRRLLREAQSLKDERRGR